MDIIVHYYYQYFCCILLYEELTRCNQNETTEETCVSNIDIKYLFLRTLGLDGIDIDWEFPAQPDKDGYTQLIQVHHTQIH